MSKSDQSSKRADRLKSALRDNLKKRKVFAKKLKTDEDQASIKLRDRDLQAKSD